MDRWARRERVATLLRRGTGEKLARAGAGLRVLREAYRLAREPEPLHAPWPALTAYRLAHAQLAEPSPALDEVDALFEQACAFGHLGPWPHVYRVGVMSRRGAAAGAVEEAFAAAVRSYQRWSARPADPQLASVPVGTARTDLHNLVDLAGVFVGADRSALSGRGLREDFAGTDGPHVVLVPGASGAPLARVLAEAELEVLSEQLGARLVFRLPADAEVSWSPREGDASHGAAETEMRLLSSLMLGDARSPEQLAARASGQDTAAAVTTLRQTRRRLRARLESAGIELSGEALKQRDESGRFLLEAGPPLVGLVSLVRYRAPL